MYHSVLSRDTQTILLLCGGLSGPRDGAVRPLTVTEYDRVAQRLVEHDMRPADLLTIEGRDELVADGTSEDGQRLSALLDRGAALALAVESWTNRGLWVLGRADETYPHPLIERLGRLVPPLLYGAGDPSLLAKGGLAILGSRNVSGDVLAFTAQVARTCARDEIQVVSGGARGVDSEAMAAALDAGGTCLGVLADSLARVAISGKYRQPLLDGKLTLVSPYDPASGFTVGNAMGRNKHIYALADWALIVQTDYEKGGTWAGAVEALKASTIPVFVNTQGDAPEGNRRLLDAGALPFPDEWDAGLRAGLAQTVERHECETAEIGTPAIQTSLFVE